jgi:glutathione synthase/RimK-type ligase-like ATP-grasp enzyme
MPARQTSLLFVIGSDLPPDLTADGRPKYAGCTDLHRLFDKREPVHVLRLTRQMLRQRRRPELDPYRCILNLVTDPDQNPRTLDNLKKLLRGYRGQVLNPPEAVLRTSRDQVARRLAGTPGLIVPKVIRLLHAKPDVAVRAIEQAGLRFPLIVRKAGTHTGVILGLFETVDALRAALTEPGEHIITEFVDFRSPDGVYRKYRAFFIGERIILRHLLASDQWSVHAKDRQRFMVERADLVDEERNLFARPEGAFPPGILDALGSVRERMGLDYFGMDFGIGRDGQAVLFEANATMNFFPFLSDPRLEHVRMCLKPAQEAFHAMLGCFRPVSVASGEALDQVQ